MWQEEPVFSSRLSNRLNSRPNPAPVFGILPGCQNAKGASGRERYSPCSGHFLTRSADIERSYILVYYGIIGDFVMDVFPEVIDCP